MSVVQLDLPEAYMERARRLAERRREPVDRVLIEALKQVLVAEENLAYLRDRAARGSNVDIRAILAKVPAAPPVPGDEVGP